MEKHNHSSYGGAAGAIETQTMNAFIQSPFMQWLKTFPEAPAELNFEALTSSHFLFNILQEFDVNFSPKSTPPSLANLNHVEAAESCGGGDNARTPVNSIRFKAKLSYIECVIENVKLFYENFLRQVLVVKLPDVLVICNEPPTKDSLREMDTLIWLMLGAAVQCNQRVAIVEAIKTLPVEVQEEIALKIKEVCNNPEWVWTDDISRPDSGELLSQEQINQHYLLLVNHLRNLVNERDEFAHKMVSANLFHSKVSSNNEKSDFIRNSSVGNSTIGVTSGSNITPESNHIALELSELKAQIRKLKQQLDERTETSRECKEEMEKYISKCSKLRQENLDLTQKAREARALRDELDIQRERAQKVHLLETEIQVYKDKISQNESLKSRMEEIREENKILVETKDMLEDQLQVSRKRCQQIIGLENELYICKSELGNCQMELESVKNSNIQLTEENSALQMSSKNSMSESQSLMAEMQMIKDTGRGNNDTTIMTDQSFLTSTKISYGNNDTNIMTEQLSKDTAKMHRLELENQRLKSNIEDLKMNGIKEQSEKCLKLERENKCQALTIKQLKNKLSSSNDDECLSEFGSNTEHTMSTLERRFGNLTSLELEHSNLKEDYKNLRLAYNLKVSSLTESELDRKKILKQLKINSTEHDEDLKQLRFMAQINDTLTTINNSFTNERICLVNQVSLLLSQYHELLTQTMEDKEHFHEEEKFYSDKMNNLSRQKEKLEEKIMEQYKRMENSTPKKIGIGGQLVRKMKKASSNLISTGNRSRTSGNYRSQTANGIGSLSQEHGISSSNSMDNNFRSDTLSNEYLNNNRVPHHSTALELDSCSSLNGNDLDSCNDSSEGTVDHPGGRSPSPLVDRLSGIHDLMSKSESGAQDFSKRKASSNLQLSSSTSFSSSAQNSIANPASHLYSPNLSNLSQNLNPAFRRSMPPHLEDSDGNNADDDSVNSFNLSGSRQLRSGPTGARDYQDDIPTRDIGPDRLIGHSSNHSEIGLPISTSNDNRSRYVSRVSINGKESSAMNNLPGGNDFRIANTTHHPSSLRYQTSSWKNNSGGSSGASTGVSPNHSSNEDHNGEERNTPPIIPARKQSRAGQVGSDNNSGPSPPQRPPKPGRTRPNTTLQSPDNNISAGYSHDDTSSTNTIDDDENKKIDSNKLKENAEWYEYGCV